MVCTKKILFRATELFWARKWAHPHDTGSAIMIFQKFCRMKGANRYIKILLIAFREKNHLGQFDLSSL